MRGLNRNLQTLYYSLLGEPETIYETDGDGNIIYDEMPDGTLQPRVVGETEPKYQPPVKFYGNIAHGGGAAYMDSYGVDASGYDAKLYVPKGTLELSETTLIWYRNTPNEDLSNADYKVARIPPSLDEMVYLLKGLT